MSILCSAPNMTVLENLIVKLQAHSLALDLLILERDDLTWTNVQLHLLFTRLDALRQTAQEFCALEKALWGGYNVAATPSTAADMPGA